MRTFTFVQTLHIYVSNCLVDIFKGTGKISLGEVCLEYDVVIAPSRLLGIRILSREEMGYCDVLKTIVCMEQLNHCNSSLVPGTGTNKGHSN